MPRADWKTYAAATTRQQRELSRERPQLSPKSSAAGARALATAGAISKPALGGGEHGARGAVLEPPGPAAGAGRARARPQRGGPPGRGGPQLPALPALRLVQLQVRVGAGTAAEPSTLNPTALLWSPPVTAV